jgi:hypothetical protein
VPETCGESTSCAAAIANSNPVRVVPELRQLVEFRRLNFMDADFGLSEKADVIFCRNVIIYFDRPTQERIVQKLAAQLLPGGYAFVGHSETLHDMDVPLAPVAPALYRKTMLELESEVSERFICTPGSHTSLASRRSSGRFSAPASASPSGVPGSGRRLCHAQLPRCPANSSGGLSLANGRRYVDFAIRDLARQFDELGASRAEVQVKLFGGADVLLVSDTAPRNPPWAN